MSQYDPSPPPGHLGQPGPPGPPRPPDPDPGHLLARRGVRWTIIGVLVTAALGALPLVTQSRQPSNSNVSAGGTGPSGSTTSQGAGPSTSTSPSETTPPADNPDADGLTAADRDLRDSLNTDQWQPQSCEHVTVPGATAGLRCTVTTEDVDLGTVTTKAGIAMYPSKSKLQEVYWSYAARLPEGNCDDEQNVRGSWYENDSTTPDGDMACYASSATEYVIFCTYYDRPALFQVTGSDPVALTNWWHGLDPVFTD
ncbi:hypothetical protein [Streptomyces sp. NPDC058614]|uniref:hypothetical protein n=1 Tax=Streptomyces sp. NPDC058614 TaxID=3346557 RepID=UPI003648A6EA